VFIDGVYAYEVPDGGLREDVGDAFPNFPDSDESGFSMAFNYKSLEPGTHAITVRAYSESGDFSEDSNTFTTSRFVSNFISRRDAIDFSTATNVALIDLQTVLFQGIVVEDRSWDIQLRWDTATQGMEIVDITPSQQEAECENFSGAWSGNLSGTETVSGGGFLESEDYFESTAFAISQIGCSIVVQLDDPFYLPIPGSASGNRLTLSGVPLAKEDFARDLEELLVEEGIVGVVAVQSITLEATATLDGSVLQLDGEIAARGNVSSGAQVFSFEYTYSFSGDLSR
jgi:hypothetical protein